MREKRYYRFGAYSLDATAKVLSRDGQPVHLNLKAVETLLALVRNAGEVVTKDEIMAAVWPGRVVDEANLAQNIAVVRKALPAEKGAPEYVETFAGRGYRIVGPVTVETRLTDEIDALPHSAPGSLAPEPRPGAPLWSRRWALAAFALPLAAGVWWWWQGRTKSAPPIETPRITAATRLAGRESQPALSPDGRSIAFVWSKDDTGSDGIWVLRAGEASPRQIGGGEAHYSSPVWSADGGRLAYLRTGTRSTEIRIASSDTNQDRLLAELTPPVYGIPGRMLDWSPDGDWLAFSHAESPARPLGLNLIRLKDGFRTRLTQPDGVVGGDIDPRFSPDGRSIAFIRVIHRSHQEIFRASLTSGSPPVIEQLTSENRQISSHDWVSDSTLVVASDRGGEFRLWRLELGRGAKTPPMEATGVYGDFPIELSYARRSPVLAYTVQHVDRNIWTFEFKTAKWRRLIASTGQDASPQLSPDGRRVCFRSDRSGEDQLWVSDVDGATAPRPITPGNLYPSVGRWAPDGRSIVFNNSRTRRVHLAEQQSPVSWSVRDLGFDGVHPVFAADGQSVLAGGDRIVCVALAGGAPSVVAATTAISLGLTADGSQVLFVREPQDSTLWKADLRTGALSRVLDGLVPGCTSCWAPSTGGIYYLGNNRDSFDDQVLYFHDFATGKARAVTPYPEPLPPFGSGPFALAPDGASLLSVRVDKASSDIMRVQPFR